jgi:rubrerythrin
MAGGIKAWHGQTAAGEPEAGKSFFPATATPEELIALAWTLEEGSRKFYSSAVGMFEENDARVLFEGLVSAEEHHKTSLRELYQDFTGRTAGHEFPRHLTKGASDEDLMEGAVKISDALAWAKGKNAVDLLELCIALEADSYDLYIKMGRAVSGNNGKKVFDGLAAEEREHLNRMATLLEKKRGG